MSKNSLKLYIMQLFKKTTFLVSVLIFGAAKLYSQDYAQKAIEQKVDFFKRGVYDQTTKKWNYGKLYEGSGKITTTQKDGTTYINFQTDVVITEVKVISIIEDNIGGDESILTMKVETPDITPKAYVKNIYPHDGSGSVLTFFYFEDISVLFYCRLPNVKK